MPTVALTLVEPLEDRVTVLPLPFMATPVRATPRVPLSLVDEETLDSAALRAVGEKAVLSAKKLVAVGTGTLLTPSSFMIVCAWV